MCGRYDLSENPAAIRAKFSVPSVPEFKSNIDVRPTELNPIIRLNRARDANECALARWGLVPSWAKDLTFGTRCINARAESVATARRLPRRLRGAPLPGSGERVLRVGRAKGQARQVACRAERRTAVRARRRVGM